MPNLRLAALLTLVLTLTTSCLVAADPYVYSPTPCDGCWHGVWNGRDGWHRGAGRPWEREHHDGDHLGEGHRGQGPVHAGHFN